MKVVFLALASSEIISIFQGHGGAKASHYCTQHLLTRLIEFAFSCVAEDKVGQRENSPEQRITASSDAADSKRGSGQKSKILQEKIFEAIRKAFCRFFAHLRWSCSLFSVRMS